MLGNIKMLHTMGFTHVTTALKRNRYTYGNKNYEVKESREEIYSLMKLLCNRMIKAASMDLNIMGKENLPEKGPVLYIANHKSIFDIVVLISVIDKPCLFIGKKELANVPFVSTWFDALGCIYLDREDKREALKAIMDGIRELGNGQSVVIFPEGTRSGGDEILDFKEGSFRLATKSKVPVVPIALHNTYKVFEEHRGIRRATVTVNIGKPIETAHLSKEELQELPKKTNEVVRTLMKDILTSI